LREVPDLASWRAEIIHHQAAAAADRGLKLILGKAPTGWSRAFDDPIDLPRGRQLVTLEDTGNYITKLPKAEQRAGMAGCDRSPDARRDARRTNNA
jgi:hypothetical protein